ncbi:MAG: hypothetical protein K2M44_00580 [Clostridia bacterium]|nr:hypothetical protein [Clostridia bacterium]
MKKLGAAITAIIVLIVVCLCSCVRHNEDILADKYENIAASAGYVDTDGHAIKQSAAMSGDDGDAIILDLGTARTFNSLVLIQRTETITHIAVETVKDGVTTVIYDKDKSGSMIFCDFDSNVWAESVRITVSGDKWALSQLSLYDLPPQACYDTVLVSADDIIAGKCDDMSLALADSIIVLSDLGYNSYGNIYSKERATEQFISAVDILKAQLEVLDNSDADIIAALNPVYDPEIDTTDDLKYLRYKAMAKFPYALINGMMSLAREHGLAGVSFDLTDGLDEASSQLYISTFFSYVKMENPKFKIFITADYTRGLQGAIKLGTAASQIFRQGYSVPECADRILFKSFSQEFYVDIGKIAQVCKEEYRNKISIISDSFEGEAEIRERRSYLKACGLGSAADTTIAPIEEITGSQSK